MSLEVVSSKLGWPSRKRILTPSGAGPRVLAKLAALKIRDPLSRSQGCPPVGVGLLTANPEASTTDAPLAVVCEFHRQAPASILRLAHKLAWNFCHAPLLVTIEPSILRAWTCCKSPAKDQNREPAHAELDDARWNPRETVSEKAARVLDWVQLLSGETFRYHQQHFPRKGCADQLLLANLKYVRERLLNVSEANLDEDTCHDLLARVIFTQFLFQRQDSSGKSALNAQKLEELHGSNVLAHSHPDLCSILGSKQDTYRLFQWLNDRFFNGDLFPGKGQTKQEREAAWGAEMGKVKDEHLRLLAEFAGGQGDMAKGQLRLWREYSFDAIPLEFISSLYEEFVSGRRGSDEANVAPTTSGRPRSSGLHYTPGHLVDFILDGVLPWEGSEWNLKVLDPACGSGIFLVKALQRLIERWKAAHPKEAISAPVLRGMLEGNLRGVDIDPHAVRVASFSLYLAMCDEIDPKHYWTQVKFPTMRGERLIHADFFREDVEGIRTDRDEHSYDLVVGNAPWGQASIKGSEAPGWAQRYGWSIANKNIGTLFLAKAAALTKESGCVGMLQPAGALLFNRESTATKFREKLFCTFKVEEVVNLSTLRFGLFANAVSPACIVTLSPTPPDGQPLSYVCPKPLRTAEDDFRLAIEPQDLNWISPREAAREPNVWTALAWGGRRDLVLVTRMKTNKALARLKGVLRISEGIIRGNQQETWPESVGRPILESDRFPAGTFLHLDASQLPDNANPRMRRAMKRNRPAFDPPQMLIGQSWRVSDGRFQAMVVLADPRRGGTLCSQSFVSAHASEECENILDAACLSLNSIAAVYYLLLTSGRFASYRPEALVEEILSVPIPEPRPGLLDGLRTFEDVDGRVKEAFGFKDAEWALVEDLFNYTLPDFKGGADSPGRKRTRPNGSAGNDKHLKAYCEYFMRVLRAGFGQDKRVSATIFQEGQGELLPLRMVAIHLGSPGRQGVICERMGSPALRERLLSLHRKFLRNQESAPGFVSYTRVVRLYDSMGGDLPTIFLIKPDQKRHWTRSMAMRDADEVAADIMLYRESNGKASVARLERCRG